MSQLDKIIKNAFLYPLLVAALFGVNPAQAELKFERTVIEDTVSPDSKSYPFEFAFKNEGGSAVEISKIKTSCGCTTAKLDKKVYAAGESGVIKGTFSVGDRKGLQQNSISVLTEDLGQPVIELGLSLAIPQMITMKPGLLLWRVGADTEAKTLSIIPNKELGVKILSIETDDSSFTIERSSSSASGEYLASVMPKSLDSQGRSLIRVQVAQEDSPKKVSTFFAHAIVR
ncbi:DUF1573 domain-containing protein [Coraliomargarita sp. SDUM461004]|uniref:DUF1573 domain-containing protein n=1 Tax=Thalassobacterium sedimentorum TaxID=3041258 RepID=A0ABU1AN89_9BACT|nr:DUF1573 domain-containing protein [Coraliomargarita sp. SDUM461004]MDQ8196214.1 DUF1573 domain-containing protein [Coraliomargarita sp. SDUM461004]